MNRALQIALCVRVVFLAAVPEDMFNQPRYKTYAADPFFPDGASARPLRLIPSARGHAELDTEYFQGLTKDGKLVETFPKPVTRAVLERGR